MTVQELIRQRLRNNRLTGTSFKTAAEVVSWLGAVQSQDYTGAKWALGLRANGLTDAKIDQAFNQGKILRTHVLRPTWHFVMPEDIRWMQALTAPRVKGILAHYDRMLGLDDALYRRTNAVMEEALTGTTRTRAELGEALQRAGIKAEGQRLGHIVSHAELDAIICSGGLRGKQFTYALVDERAPKAKKFDRDESLVKLAMRYFMSRGPAQVKDFSWWSGLTVADATAAIALLKGELVSEEVEGLPGGEKRKFWFARKSAYLAPASKSVPRANLFSNYDEYGIAYADRSAMLLPQYAKRLGARGNATFAHVFVFDGQVIGMWRRTYEKDVTVVTAQPFKKTFSPAERTALTEAARRYGEFLGRTVVVR